MGVLVACASHSDAPAPASDGGSGGVTFRKSVVPVVERWCSSEVCHGAKPNQIGLVLQPKDPDGMYAELRKESPTAKGAMFVVPLDPAKSFFLAKIEGNQSDFESQCTVSGCGESMPPGTKIDLSDRDAIRAWIAAGAKND